MIVMVADWHLHFPFTHTITSHHHKWSESHSVVSDSLRPQGLYYPWNSPGQDTWVGSLSLLHKDSMNRQKKYFLHLMDVDMESWRGQATCSRSQVWRQNQIPTQLFCWACPSTALLWHCLGFCRSPKDHLSVAMWTHHSVFQDCQPSYCLWAETDRMKLKAD